MFTVGDVKSDVQRVLGACSDSEFYTRINDIVEILATECDFSQLRGYLDVCVNTDRTITLPNEVDTPLAVNIGGMPSMGHDFWFRFHLNGPGDSMQQVGFHWHDRKPTPVFRDPTYSTGDKLTCILESATDNGVAVRVFGYDVSGNWIRTFEGGEFVDGFLVPTVYGSTGTHPTAPKIRNIVRVSKPVTAGVISLYAVADDLSLTKLGQYSPDETEPLYRRIQISKQCTWARVAFRKRITRLSKLSDLVLLPSRYAIILMAKSLKKMDEDRIEEAKAYKAEAIHLLDKKSLSLEIPGGPSVQVADNALIANKSDRIDM